MAYNTLVVLLGVCLLGACSGLIGTFAVLRRRSLMGDALAHAALPGLCIAFLVLGQRSLPAMLAGALVSGIVGVLVVSGLQRVSRIKEDAAIGIVLSTFFGAGVVLSRIIQNQPSGGSKAGLDSYILGKTAGIILSDVIVLGGMALICVVLVLLLFKEFKLVAFDADFARVQGWPALAIDLLLMALVAVTVVIGLPAVGVVLMAAMLILPAAAARFWTQRLSAMLLLSAAFGILIGAAGTLASASYSRMPTGPVIVIIGSLVFLVSLLAAPRRGIVARWTHQLRVATRLRGRLALCALYDESEPLLPERPLVDARKLAAGASPFHLHRALRRLRQTGVVEQPRPGHVRLTDSGLLTAAAAARRHRLWELALQQHPELIADFGESAFATIDETLPPAVIDRLERQLAQSGRLPRVHQPSAS